MNNDVFILNILFQDKRSLDLMDISETFDDIVLLYNSCLFSSKYGENYLSFEAFDRVNKLKFKNPTPSKEKKLEILKISKNSPLELTILATTSIGIIWTFAQLIEKIMMLEVNINNKLLENRKLELEIKKLAIDIDKNNKIKKISIPNTNNKSLVELISDLDRDLDSYHLSDVIDKLNYLEKKQKRLMISNINIYTLRDIGGR